MNNESDEQSTPAGESEKRPSWPYPTFLFLYVVIFFITPFVGSTIGLIMFFGLLGFCLWGAISPDQYEQLRKSYPALSRHDYVLNNLIFPVIVPLIIFIILMVYKHSS
jgi:hypothetical protein